jgi:hypothetical protein
MNVCRSTTVPIIVLFGFDSVIAEGLPRELALAGESIVIWYGGKCDERFRLKDWWLRTIESHPAIETSPVLVIGGTREDSMFAVGFISLLAEQRVQDKLEVSIRAPQEASFAGKAALRYRQGKFTSRIERLQATNVSLLPTPKVGGQG